MELKGGCYCQSVKYEINGDVKFAQCQLQRVSVYFWWASKCDNINSRI